MRACLLALVAAAIPACAAPAARADWAPLPDLPSARALPAAATSAGGDLIVFGGATVPGFTPLADVDALAPGGLAWSPAGTLTGARFGAVAFPSAAGIVVAGGLGATQGSPATELYNPATQTTTPLADLPAPRTDAASAQGPDGRIWIFGGRSGGTALATSVIYDPGTDTWSAGPALPRERVSGAATLGPDGRFYLFGGGTGAGDDLATDVFDPATQQWRAGPQLPAARYRLRAMTGADDAIYLAGGTADAADPAAAVATVLRYDPATGAWSDGPALATARMDHAAATSDDDTHLYVAGGLTGSGPAAATATAEELVVTPATPGAPVATDQPEILGEPQVGQTVHCYPGGWIGEPTFAFTWQIDGVDIPGAAAGELEIPADAVDKSLTCTVAATNGAGTTTEPSAAITPDPDSPLVAAVAGTPSVTEGDAGTTPMEFTITLSRSSHSPVTVAFHAAGVTATAQQDFTAQNGTVTFAPGETTKPVTVQVRGDMLTEGDETLELVLDSTTRGALGATVATGTILDDEPQPALAVASPVTVTEPDAGATTQAQCRFTISVPTTGTVSATYATVAGTATSGTDFQPAGGPLLFAAGETEVVVSVPITGDAADEPDETLRVTLGAVLGASNAATPPACDIVIADNDPTPPSGGGPGGPSSPAPASGGQAPAPPACRRSSATALRFADTIADTLGARDIEGVAVVAGRDCAVRITVDVDDSALRRSDLLTIALDADGDPLTGDPALGGADRVLRVHGPITARSVADVSAWDAAAHTLRALKLTPAPAVDRYGRTQLYLRTTVTALGLYADRTASLRLTMAQGADRDLAPDKAPFAMPLAFRLRTTPDPGMRAGLRGRARPGRKLTCRVSGNYPGSRVTYAWLRNGKRTPGGKRTYRVRPRDRGRRIACRATAWLGKRPQTVRSAAIRVR